MIRKVCLFISHVINNSLVLRWIIIISIPIILLFTSQHCKSPTEFIDNATPGRRDYTWTIDTLNIYSPAYKIWGSSPTDVWAINESDHNKCLFHFDGNLWSTDSIYRNILPHAIFGFSYNNIYIGGSSGGKIWQYNGNNWKQTAALTKEGTTYVAFENIWGDSPNNIYAIGSGPDDKGLFNCSVIAHFTNNQWTMLNTDGLKGNVAHLYKSNPDNKIYMRVTRIGGGEFIDSTLIYEYVQNIFIQEKYNKIYSSIWSKGLQADISLINGEVYFILGSRIARRINNQFQTVLEVDNPNFYQRIWGRNSKDIFLLMTDGLAHYNGTGIEYLFYFSKPTTKPWTQVYDAALFEKEVFFTVYEPPTDLKLIYHGKLKD